MGLVYDHYHVEPVNDEEIALVVGGERAPTARSVARKVIRVALTIAAAFLLLNAYIVPLNFWVHPRQAESLKAATDPHDRTWDDFEFGEEIKCYGKDDFEPAEPEEPYPEQLQWVKVPDTILDSDDIYFFARTHPESRGRTTGGGIVFDAVEDVDQITLGAVIGYEHHPYAKLCTYKRENGALGFGVVVPKHEHHHDDDKHQPHHPPAEPHPPRRPPHDHAPDPHPPHRRHRFHRANVVHLRVKFPLAKDGQTFQVKNLETSLPLYRHIIGDLGDKVEFSSISLRGSNSPIFSESLSAATADVRTTNAPIDGNFTGTNELSIHTVNAPVKVHIAFTSTLADTPARLSVGTLNAKLDAEIGLAAEGDAGVGSFEVVATTVNAPLLVAFTDAPVGSQLSLEAKTANAPADVILHPTYEGTVEAKTAWFEASLNVRDDSEDPTGKGRKRNAQVTKVNRSFFQGEVTWGEKTDDTPAGEVIVHTSLSRVSITV